MPLLPAVRCERHLSARLSARERHALLTMASRVAPGLDLASLLQRLARYEQVWIARREGQVAAFLLVQELATPEATLLYIGPAFSCDGAYAYAFAALVGERLCVAQPVLIAMEVENPSVQRMLERLVPSHVFPRAAASPQETASLRALASRALARLPHVIDFDPDSMTSAIVGPTDEAETAARYQVLLVSCAGDLQARAGLGRELARGLKGLSARARHVPSACETRDG
jgi:hypothetical protein